MSRRDHRHAYTAALLVAVAAGFALRLPLLDRFPLREDEAIYAYWALHGRHVDPLFLDVWLDKPPIFIWLLSLAFESWGATPAAARLLNIGFSTLTIPVVAATARRWWGDMAGIAAALLIALSPFAISFAPTAFTDPLLVLAGALSLCLAAQRRWFWSGLWLGVAIMTKQQGLLFVPLILAAGLVRRDGDAPPSRSAAETPKPRIHNSQFLLSLATFLLGLLAIIVPVMVWDSLRWSVAPSPWDLGARNVGPVTLSDPTQWPDRLRAWRDVAWYLMGSWAAWLIAAGAILAAMVARVPLPIPPQVGEGAVKGWRDLLPSGREAAPRRQAAAPSLVWGRSTHLDPAVLLALWALFFLLVHVMTSVQVWDRYLLPLVLPLALLGGWAAARLARSFAPAERLRFPAVAAAVPGAAMLVTILAWPAVQAAGGGFPVGGDHGAYDGLDAAYAYVREANEGDPVVLYHRELGWHARFYLFDTVGTGDVELRYYPHAVYLADSATKLPHKRHLAIVPDWAPMRDLGGQLANRGLTAQARLRTGHFTVLEIAPIARGDTGWRVCRPASAALPTWPSLTGARGEDMMCRQ
jgi:hypothetical protein